MLQSESTHYSLLIESTMSEQELKLHVPQQSRAKVQKALEKAEKISLRAMYFDTSDRQLAKAKVAIRLRQEGDKWVQTLKMAGSHSLSRIELNHHRPGPLLDLSLYAGTEAEPILTQLSKPLELRYETDVIRLFKTQSTHLGKVEIAYDTGIIRAGRLELPLYEVEFELKSGDICAMFQLGQRWLKQYNLILDMRTKSHRGDSLANMMARINATEPEHQLEVESQETSRFWTERKARPYALNKNLTATQALCRLTDECIEQISSNAAYLAEVDTAGVLSVARPGHVHQLRIGIRRLLSNWKLFKGLAHLPSEELQTQIRAFLARFGSTRDTDVMINSIMPSLHRAGMPVLEVDHYSGKSASDIAREVAFQSLLVQLLEWLATVPQADPSKEAKDKENTARKTEAPSITASSAEINKVDTVLSQQVETTQENLSTHTDIVLSTSLGIAEIIPLVPSTPSIFNLRKALEKRLSKWNKGIISHWRYHDKNDIEAYHDLRKRIKKMRYGLNVYEGLEGHADLSLYIKRLAQAQEVFGILNDHASALAYFEKITDKTPQAWFAVGYLTAQLKRLMREADKALKRLPKRISF